MIEQEKWVFFRNIDWDDPKFNKFNVDTRDFHVGYQEDKVYSDIIKNPEDYLISKEKLVDLLERYYSESGGEKNWRLFILKDYKEGSFWALKYLRVFRSDKGFLVCTSKNNPISIEDLNREVYIEDIATKMAMEPTCKNVEGSVIVCGSCRPTVESDCLVDPECLAVVEKETETTIWKSLLPPSLDLYNNTTRRSKRNKKKRTKNKKLWPTN